MPRPSAKLSAGHPCFAASPQSGGSPSCTSFFWEVVEDEVPFVCEPCCVELPDAAAAAPVAAIAASNAVDDPSSVLVLVLPGLAASSPRAR